MELRVLCLTLRGHLGTGVGHEVIYSCIRRDWVPLTRLEVFFLDLPEASALQLDDLKPTPLPAREVVEPL